MSYNNHALFKKTEKGVLLSLKVSPNASKNQLGKIMVDAKGHSVLKVFVMAVPEDGKANQAVIDLLAKNFHLKKSQFTIYRGETDKNKTILITPGNKLETVETLYQFLLDL